MVLFHPLIFATDNVVGRFGVVGDDDVCAVFYKASDVLCIVDCPKLHCKS